MPTEPTRSRLLLGHHAERRAGLGHAVAVRHRCVGQPVLQAAQRLGRQRRAAERHNAQARQVGGLEARVVDEQLSHGRHDERRVGLLALDGSSHRPASNFGRYRPLMPIFIGL